MAQIDDNAEVPPSSEVQQADLSSEEWQKRIRQLVKWKPRLWWGAVFVGTVSGIFMFTILAAYTKLDPLSVFLICFVLGGSIAGAFAGFRGTMHGMFTGLFICIAFVIISASFAAALGRSLAAFYSIGNIIIRAAVALTFGTLGGGLGFWLRNKIGFSAKYDLMEIQTEARKEAAVLELSEALRHSDPDVRLKAAKALKKFGTSADDAVPALIAALSNDEEYLDVTRSVIKALGATRSLEAIPTLVEIMSDDSWERIVRDEATVALANIGRVKQGYEHTAPPPDSP